MRIHVGLENGNENRSIAWALDLPGCYAYGTDEKEALLAVPLAVLTYQDWIEKHTPDSWLKNLGDFDVRLVEVFNGYTVDENFDLAEKGYEVNAFFRDDWKALTRVEARRAAQMLTWINDDLLAVLPDLPAEILDRTYEGERWSIRGILGHIAGANWWYLERLGLAAMERRDIPRDPFERMQTVQARLLTALGEMEGMQRVVGRDGELWSPRKVIRRAIWHGRDHIEHIQKLLTGMG